MKKNYKLLIFFCFIIISFLYFDNKFNENEVDLYNKKYTIHSKEERKIKVKSGLKKIKVYTDIDNVGEKTYFFFDIISDNKIIHTEKIYFRELQREYYTINLEKYKFINNKTYHFKIRNIDSLNNIEFQCNLEFYYSNNKKNVFIVLYSSGLLFYEAANIHKTFLFIAIPIFALYIIFIPMLAGHDEKYQWIKSYALSEGIIIPSGKGTYLVSKLPKNINFSLPDDGNFKYNDLLSQIKLKINNNERFYISAGSMDVYSPIQFLPQTIGIVICRFICSNTLLISYFGRLFNMLFCLVILTLAIKTTPIGKKVLFLFALSPLAIELFTTLSGDGLTISISFLLIAYILKMREKDKYINRNKVIVLSVLSCILALCKIVYIVIPFLLFLIPKGKYKNKSRKLPIIFSIIIPVVLNLLWLFIASSVSDYCSGYSIPSKNLSIVLSNPFKIFKYFIYSIEIYGFQLFFDFFSKRMLMCHVIENTTIVPLLLLFTFTYIINDRTDGNIKLSKREKILCLAIILICSMLIYLSIYISWCSYNDIKIYGVQGRYFFPLIPVIVILIKSVIKCSNKKYSNDLLYYTVFIVNFMTLMEIIIQFL